MEDKQVPERDFVREKIKNKPLNHRRILVKAAVAALCGVVFALTMGFTLYVLMPGLRRQWEESQPVSETQTATEETQAVTQVQETQKQETPKPEEITVQNKREPISIEDYQRIQTELYAIGNRANLLLQSPVWSVTRTGSIILTRERGRDPERSLETGRESSLFSRRKR